MTTEAKRRGRPTGTTRPHDDEEHTIALTVALHMASGERLERAAELAAAECAALADALAADARDALVQANAENPTTSKRNEGKRRKVAAQWQPHGTLAHVSASRAKKAYMRIFGERNRARFIRDARRLLEIIATLPPEAPNVDECAMRSSPRLRANARSCTKPIP